jgi:hypothetical protein
MEIFKTALYIGYEQIFGKACENRLDFVKSIPRRHLIAEIAGLNHRLKSAVEKEFKSGLNDQLKELEYFCGGDKKVLSRYYFEVKQIHQKLQGRKGGGTPLIFNRPANLYALQEILEKLPDEDDANFKWNTPLWENLLKYYLCINDVISFYNSQDEDETHNPFEKLASGSGFLNELMVANDPILTMDRFVYLFEYIRKDDLLSSPLDEYFKKIGLEAKAFVSHIFSICFLHKSDQEHLKFCHKLDKGNSEHEEAFLIFDYFSRRGLVSKVHDLDLIELKKSPMYKDINDFYFILDNLLIIEKMYELFINDFWFEAVKSRGINIKLYKSKIGYFFEGYVSSKLKEGLSFLKYPPIKCLDELKVKVNNNLIELADFYCRQNKKVAVGQIKSTGIYSDQQYGTAQSLFRNSEDLFYDIFGLNQLIESVRYLRDTPQLFEKEFPVDKAIQIFPILVVNEKIFQTPFLPAMFQLKFAKEIKKESFRNFDIKPLAIFHVSDIERLTYHLRLRKVDFWELLKSNYHGSLFPKPFNITLNRNKLNPDYELAKKRIVEFTGIK